MTSKKSIFLSLIFIIAVDPVFPQSGKTDFSAYYPHKMGFFDLATGPDFRYNHLQSHEKVSFNSAYLGWHFKVQNSFFASALHHKFKRFVFGDLISAELSAGNVFSDAPNLTPGFRWFYNFELGAGFLYHFSKDFDLAYTVAVLKFGKDFWSDYFSGSNFYFKIRYKRIFAETGIITENRLYTGAYNFFPDTKDEIIKLALTGRYFFKPEKYPEKYIGIRFECMPINRDLYLNYGKENTFSLKILYGVTF